MHLSGCVWEYAKLKVDPLHCQPTCTFCAPQEADLPRTTEHEPFVDTEVFPYLLDVRDYPSVLILSD